MVQFHAQSCVLRHAENSKMKYLCLCHSSDQPTLAAGVVLFTWESAALASSSICMRSAEDLCGYSHQGVIRLTFLAPNEQAIPFEYSRSDGIFFGRASLTVS